MSYRSIHPQFKETFNDYAVPAEMQEAFWNYFAYGIDPGSFGLAVLRNDFYRAASSAHRSLDTNHFRDIAAWIENFAPIDSYGSSKEIAEWKIRTDEERRDIMIACGLRPHEFDILRGTAVT